MWRHFNPFDQLDSLFVNGPASWSTSYPAVESFRRGDSIVLRAELPGVDPKDIDMMVEKDHLIIKGEKKEVRQEKEKDVYLREVYYGCFQRAFRLPRGVRAEQVKASLRNGVLEVSFPARSLEDAGTKVPIQITAGDRQEDAA